MPSGHSGADRPEPRRRPRNPHDRVQHSEQHQVPENVTMHGDRNSHVSKSQFTTRKSHALRSTLHSVQSRGRGKGTRRRG